MAKDVALVTGASSGLGAEFARQLARNGMDVVLVARRADRLEALRAEIERASSARCHVIAKDLSRLEAPEELFAETTKLGLEIDWLVNNAGFGTNGRFVDLPLAKEREEILLNVHCLVALSRLYSPAMVARRRGAIVNLGSIGAFLPTPYMATYSATKAFVLSFSEALAAELASTGVGVLALCPGATKTEFQEVAGVAEAVPEFTYMTAEAVVTQAIAAAKAGKRTLVPGWMNKTLAVTTRMTPRSVLARIAGSMFAPKAA
jgi:short-subunit dehydrogenase